MEPGAYDVLLKVSSYGAGFVLASNVVVREGTLTRINPNALVGGIAVEPVSKKGFPLFKSLEFIDRSTGDKRLLAQQTDKLGVTLPIAPGDLRGDRHHDRRAARRRSPRTSPCARVRSRGSTRWARWRRSSCMRRT